MSSLLGLSAVDANLYAASLNTSCEVAWQVHTMNLSHQLIASIDPVLLDGQIDYTGGDTDTVTQMATLSFLDPDRTLRLDGVNPNAGVGGLDRLIQLRSYVRSELTDGRWIGAPAFTGRPSAVGRDGDKIELVAESKECLHLRNYPWSYVEKGWWTITAIAYILRAGGETRFRFPSVTAGTKLSHRVYYGGDDDAQQPWKVAWRMARNMGMQLYYDKTGYACLRKYPQAPMWTVREQDDGANTLSQVKTNSDLTLIRNRVIVRAMTTPPKAKKGQPAVEAKPITGEWNAHWTHPNSASALTQNGKPWSNTAVYDEPDIHTKAAADAFAAARGAELLTQETQVELNIIPIWHADPMDQFKVEAANGADFQIRLLSGSTPVGPSDSGMSIGYNKRVPKATAGKVGQR